MSINAHIPPRTSSVDLLAALLLSNGAQFQRCALQVNPFAYLTRYKKPTTFSSEQEYNRAIVEACLTNDVRVIAVMDHFRVVDSVSLANLARESGIFVFNGFEANTSDGVHWLCFFDPQTTLETLQGYIGSLGVHDTSRPSPLSNIDSCALLERVHGWRGVCVAAHVAHDGQGLLAKLSGQSRIRAFTHEHLLACDIAGAESIAQLEQKVRLILQNKNADHARVRGVAIINAKDVCSPSDLAVSTSTTQIKMSTISTEALRQAFLEPASRIRLNSDPRPAAHAQFVAIHWNGGFLDGSALHFNENLNVVIGGRGSGKSTLIESIRYALGVEPLGDESLRLHRRIINDVIGAQGKITLLLRSTQPDERYYTIERTVPDPPRVRTESGNVLNIAPTDILPGVEVFGQHELLDLTSDPQKLTRLLDRFVEPGATVSQQARIDLRLELERSRSRILTIEKELAEIQNQLAALPGIQETLKRFADAGLDHRLKEKTALSREQRIFDTTRERLVALREVHQRIAEISAIDLTFLSDKAISELPNAEYLAELRSILSMAGAEIADISRRFGDILSTTNAAIAAVSKRWDLIRTAADARYTTLAKELQKEGRDPAAFVRIRAQVEDLLPLRERSSVLLRERNALYADRRNQVAAWEQIKLDDGARLRKAASKVSKNLDSRVRVEVNPNRERSSLKRLLKEFVGGNLTAVDRRIDDVTELSLPALAAALRSGADATAAYLGVTSSAAQKMVLRNSELAMRVEELVLGTTTTLSLNISSDQHHPNFQRLDRLSTGQKATAILLLLLLESDMPLVVDQPEDDLDNRFITEAIVPIMQAEKQRRQFVFTTHNANVPVLGDAELIACMRTKVDATGVTGFIDPADIGSIDSPVIQAQVEDILEGGKTAFELRRLKYGF